MKFDEFARKLNNEIESVQPNVLDKIKSTPVTAENLGCGPLATLVWVKAKKFVIPVIYAICAVFVFLLCFSTISADNVGVSDFTYLNISIGDSQEKSADFDFALDKNGRILKVTLGNSSNVDSDKIEQTVLSTIGMTITDAIDLFGSQFAMQTASVNVGVLNDSASIAKSVEKAISHAIKTVYSAATVNSLTSGLTKDIIVSKTKSLLKSATKFMTTDELVKILFG